MDLFLIRHVWQFVQQASTKWKRKSWMASNPGLPRTQTFNHAQIMQLYLSHRGLRRRLTDYADLLTWSCLLTLAYVSWQEKNKGPRQALKVALLFIVSWICRGYCIGGEKFKKTQHKPRSNVWFLFFSCGLWPWKGQRWNENGYFTVMLEVAQKSQNKCESLWCAKCKYLDVALISSLAKYLQLVNSPYLISYLTSD